MSAEGASGGLGIFAGILTADYTQGIFVDEGMRRRAVRTLVPTTSPPGRLGMEEVEEHNLVGSEVSSRQPAISHQQPRSMSSHHSCRVCFQPVVSPLLPSDRAGRDLHGHSLDRNCRFVGLLKKIDTVLCRQSNMADHVIRVVRSLTEPNRSIYCMMEMYKEIGYMSRCSASRRSESKAAAPTCRLIRPLARATKALGAARELGVLPPIRSAMPATFIHRH